MSQQLYLGIDLGTSGVRASAIDTDCEEVAHHATALPAAVISNGQRIQDSQLWLKAVSECLDAIGKNIDLGRVNAISVDGTSATVLLCMSDGTPLTAAMMYNDASSSAQAQRIRQLAPDDCAAQNASSSLAKVMQLRESYPKLAASHICHQADYVSSWLSGRFGISDENNCLKLGYDVLNRSWPDWMKATGLDSDLLPEVLVPGTVIGKIESSRAKQFGIDPDCLIVSGTTDSIAAFIASGANTVGDAVTSLGSTLVIKQLCTHPVHSADHGVYSHRYFADDDLWLAGGASNSGCSVLSELFSQQQIDEMSTRLQADKLTGLQYYPLPLGSEGERFPIVDPGKKPELEPRPEDDVEFFQGILESIADIEKQSYLLLEQSGCGRTARIFTAGGGSRNSAWTTIRENKMNIPVIKARHTEASVGSALLAKHACDRSCDQLS